MLHGVDWYLETFWDYLFPVCKGQAVRDGTYTLSQNIGN
jgi:hypothetical protein